MTSYGVVRARRRRPRGRGGSAAALLVFVGVVVAIAAFEGAVATSSASGWFGASAQVVWTPPPWFSRTVWAVVFLLLALAGWRIWLRAARSALALYIAVLLVLTIWPPVYLHGYPLIGTAALWLGFALAVLLVAMTAVLASLVRRATTGATVLLVPVCAWLLYVATINVGDAVLASLG